ncbi:MAG: type II toxin-antitoxin system YafQ family toxin [bacterium]|nr:type II toxin-antitoxin system YafQ family toxin [bacterium]
MLYRSSRFRKQFKKCPEKICSKTFEWLGILMGNEFDEVLNNHRLSGKYADCRSIDVTGDVRIAYKRVSDGFYLVAIGTHSELYE